MKPESSENMFNPAITFKTDFITFLKTEDYKIKLFIRKITNSINAKFIWTKTNKTR